MKSPMKIWPRSAGGIEHESGGAPKIMRSDLLGHHREAEGQQQRERRIGLVEAPEQRRARRRRRAAPTSTGEATIAPPKPISGASTIVEVGADRIEGAMGQVDDAAQREDQRQPERDQQVVDPASRPFSTCWMKSMSKGGLSIRNDAADTEPSSRAARRGSRSSQGDGLYDGILDRALRRLIRYGTARVPQGGRPQLILQSISSPWSRDDLELLVRARHRRRRGEDVPLVLDLRRRQRRRPCTSRASAGGRRRGSSRRASS